MAFYSNKLVKTINMDLVKDGILITAVNTCRRLKNILIYLITRAGSLLLRLPLASIRLLARMGGYLLDGKNRKNVIILLTTAAVIIVSRTLINGANRRRLQRESKKLFSSFHNRFKSGINLLDADDEELQRAAWDLE